MKQNNSTQDQNFRLSIKRSSKGAFTAEWTVRGNHIKVLEARDKLLGDYALGRIKKLNEEKC